MVDASNDAADTWSAVGDAIGVVRADLGLHLRCVLGGRRRCGATASPRLSSGHRGPPRKAVPRHHRAAPDPPNETHPYMRVYEGDTGDGLVEVLVVKAVKPDPGAGRLPESVRSFAARTPKFPRASITRQDFGDVEFDAYRALGEHYMGLAWEQWQQHRGASTPPSRAD